MTEFDFFIKALKESKENGVLLNSLNTIIKIAEKAKEDYLEYLKKEHNTTIEERLEELKKDFFNRETT